MTTGRWEEQCLPISALQHLVFCERQCALIHVERLWVDNQLTVEGTLLHKRVDETSQESRGDVRTARGVRLLSKELLLTGRADVVEFHRRDSDERTGTVSLPGVDGRWSVFPVEYKRGIPKRDRSDDVQLCAQALCLEETLGAHVESGAIFYAKRRHRSEIRIDAKLRQMTWRLTERLHDLVRTARTPRAERQPKCTRCSMLGVCLPEATAASRSARSYLVAALGAHLGG